MLRLCVIRNKMCAICKQDKINIKGNVFNYQKYTGMNTCKMNFLKMIRNQLIFSGPVERIGKKNFFYF